MMWRLVQILSHVHFINLITMSRSPRQNRSPEKSQETIEMIEKAREGIVRKNKKVKPFYEKYAYHLVIGGFVLVLAYALINSLWKTAPNINTTLVNDQDLINRINSNGLSFKAAANPNFKDYVLADVKPFFNSQASNKQQLYKCATSGKQSILTDNYNFRTANPECAQPIINQGNCSSSYSIAAVGAITDRFCLANKESYPRLSPQAPLACDKTINSHCKGGFVSRSLDYAKIYGLVDNNCLAYNPEEDNIPDCNNKIKDCIKYKISDYCVSSTEQGIKQEILSSGPVIVVIPVYRDFLVYKSGVFQVYPKSHRFQSGQAVKIIGWETREDQKCWLIENSWGTEWGENGIACVLIGRDQLQIERFVLAPSIPSADKPQSEQQKVEAQQYTQDTERDEIEL